MGAMGGMGGMGAMGGAGNPYGAANPFAPGFTPPAAAVDTTATTVPSGAAAAAAPAADGSRGEKFSARAAGAETGTATGTPVVEAAEVKEPVSKASSSAASSSNGSGGGGGGYGFTDVNAASSSGGAASAFFDTSAGSTGAGAAGTDAAADPSQMTAMMEKMLKDPNMQVGAMAFYILFLSRSRAPLVCCCVLPYTAACWSLHGLHAPICCPS